MLNHNSTTCTQSLTQWAVSWCAEGEGHTATSTDVQHTLALPNTFSSAFVIAMYIFPICQSLLLHSPSFAPPAVQGTRDPFIDSILVAQPVFVEHTKHLVTQTNLNTNPSKHPHTVPTHCQVDNALDRATLSLALQQEQDPGLSRLRQAILYQVP